MTTNTLENVFPLSEWITGLSLPARTFYVDGAVVNFIPRIPVQPDGSEVPSLVVRAHRVTSVGPRMPQGIQALSPYAWIRWFGAWSELFTVPLDVTYQGFEVACPLAADRRGVSKEHLIFEIDDEHCPFPRPAGLNTGARPSVYRQMYLWGQEVARRVLDKSIADGSIHRYLRDGKHIRSLVLAAGGTNIFFFLGVIKELQRRGYTADRISTCSAGGPTGAIFACGIDADRAVESLLNKLEHRMDWDALVGTIEVRNLQSFVLSGFTGWSPSKAYLELCAEFGLDWPKDIDFEMQACRVTIPQGRLATAWTLRDCNPTAVYYNKHSGITFAEAMTRSGSAPGLARPREEFDSAA